MFNCLLSTIFFRAFQNFKQTSFLSFCKNTRPKWMGKRVCKTTINSGEENKHHKGKSVLTDNYLAVFNLLIRSSRIVIMVTEQAADVNPPKIFRLLSFNDPTAGPIHRPPGIQCSDGGAFIWIKNESKAFPIFLRRRPLFLVPPPPWIRWARPLMGRLIYPVADLFICLFGPFCKTDFPQENRAERYRVAPAKPPPCYQGQIRLPRRSDEALCLWVTGGFILQNNSSKAFLCQSGLLTA